MLQYLTRASLDTQKGGNGLLKHRKFTGFILCSITQKQLALSIAKGSVTHQLKDVQKDAVLN